MRQHHSFINQLMTYLLGLDDKQVDDDDADYVPCEEDEVVKDQLRLKIVSRDSLMYPISLRAIGIPKVLIKEAAEVHHP